MECNNNYKKKIRFKSFTNTFNNRLLKFERTYSNSNYSSISKKTGAFEENVNAQTGKMNSFSTKRSPNNLCFSIQNNIAIHSSADLSLNDLKEKGDINNICTNINISIDNPNFSINNIENINQASPKTNQLNSNIKKESSCDIVNVNLISFKGSNIESESKDMDNKIISSIYADYLENKSKSEIFSENLKYDSKFKLLNEYLDKNKILQYEYNKGIISGISAYTYQNEERINKDKLSININIDKAENIYNKNKKIKKKRHLINFFSLFCGDRKDEDDELTKFLKNNFKDILLEDKEIITNPINAIKNSFAKCELKYINYFLKNQKNNLDKFLDISKIQNCSIIIILNIDNIFYIGNLGNLITILSSNLSRKIEYLSKENITQEEYDSHIKRKRNSLHSFFKHNNINYVNEINNSKVRINNNSTINNNQKDNQNILNIINLNTIYIYNYIRVFPGKKLSEIISNNNNKLNKSSTKIGGIFPLNNTTITNNNIKINNFMKNNDKNTNQKNFNNGLIRNRRASLGPFFKISPKIKNYNPTKNYRNSCAPNDSNNKTQIIKIISSFPDIISFKYKKNKHDFIFIGCNIIFQKLTNDKICKSVYDTMKKCIKKHRSFELFLGWVIKDIIKMCIEEGITSNISCLFICFNPIKQLYLKQNMEDIKNVLVPLCLTFSNQNNYEFYDELISANFIDVDKANNYYELIENNINKINENNEEIFNILDGNEINKKKNDNSDNNVAKIKNVKKRCCIFC